MLSIQSMTWNGSAITPAMTSPHFINGLSGYVENSLQDTPPGTWSTFTWLSDQWPSGTPSLASVTGTFGGGTDTAHFGTNAVGSYTMSVRYALPALVTTPTDLCPLSSQLVSVNFSVVGG